MKKISSERRRKEIQEILEELNRHSIKHIYIEIAKTETAYITFWTGNRAFKIRIGNHKADPTRSNDYDVISSNKLQKCLKWIQMTVKQYPVP